MNRSVLVKFSGPGKRTGKKKHPALVLWAVLDLAVGCENWIQAVLWLKCFLSGLRTVVWQRGEAG